MHKCFVALSMTMIESVILSEAKDLVPLAQMLRCTQDDNSPLHY
jgi:hypothetical protein